MLWEGKEAVALAAFLIVIAISRMHTKREYDVLHVDCVIQCWLLAECSTTHWNV